MLVIVPAPAPTSKTVSVVKSEFQVRDRLDTEAPEGPTGAVVCTERTRGPLTFCVDPPTVIVPENVPVKEYKYFVGLSFPPPDAVRLIEADTIIPLRISELSGLAMLIDPPAQFQLI